MTTLHSLQSATQYFEGVLNVAVSPTTIKWMRGGADELAAAATLKSTPPSIGTELNSVAKGVREAALALEKGTPIRGGTAEGLEDSHAYLAWVAADATAERLGVKLVHGMSDDMAKMRFDMTGHHDDSVPAALRDAIAQARL